MPAALERIEKLGYGASPSPLRTEREYEEALAITEYLVDRDPSVESRDGLALEFVSLLIEAYEEKHYPIETDTTPQSVVLFVLEQNGLDRQALVPLLGSRGRVSDFLNGRRRLSINQIRALREEFNIPADALMD